MLICSQVGALGVPVVTNLFASRIRIARMFGVTLAQLHETFQTRANQPIAPRYLETGPVLDEISKGEAVDLALLPMLKHFDSDRGPYITNAVIIAQDPVTGIANMSYHRSMVLARQALATSLHSRGHLWRMLQAARERGEELPVAMVVGAHPLFMLAAAARLPFGSDERAVAGGLFGAPLELVKTPRYGIGVPACAEFVLEGAIDPTAYAEEGPFGEFSGYSSDRSTNNVLRVDTLDAAQGRLAGGCGRRALRRTPDPGPPAPRSRDERKAQGTLPGGDWRALPQLRHPFPLLRGPGPEPRRRGPADHARPAGLGPLP